MTKEIIGEIENRGLNPYIGFVHKDKVGHPSLASDLIEEWRPVIVDSLVMSMIQGHEVCLDDFIIEESGCRMKDNVLVIYDVEENKKRTRIVHILESYGIRVQKSAFECHLDNRKMETLKKQLKKVIGEDDSIRIYPLRDICFDVSKFSEVSVYQSQTVII